MVHRQTILVIYGCAVNVFSDLASKYSGSRLLHQRLRPKRFIVMALPLAMLKGLQMRTSAKVGLAGVFCCAFITIVFDILRAVETDMKGGVKGSTALWTNLESAVAVIVSCLPTLSALFNPKNEHNGGRGRDPYMQRSLVISDSAKLCVSAGSSVKSSIDSRTSATGDPEKNIVGLSIAMEESAGDRTQSKGVQIV